MVLKLPCGHVPALDEDVLAAALSHPQLIQANAEFLEKASTAHAIPMEARALCVLQGECGSVDFSEHDWVIGSVDATTCVIAAVVCPFSRLAWVAHFDEPLAASDLDSWLAVAPRFQRPQLYLVGGFEEASGCSRTVCMQVLQLFHLHTAVAVELRLACLMGANTDPATGAPHTRDFALICSSNTSGGSSGRSCGASAGAAAAAPTSAAPTPAAPAASAEEPPAAAAGASTTSGIKLEPLPVGFEDRGPEVPRRMAFASLFAQEHGCMMTCVHDHRSNGLMVLPGFSPKLSSWGVMWMERKLSLPDEIFLQQSSTSPLFEGPGFVADVKAEYRWVLHAQEEPDPEDAAYVWAQGEGWVRQNQ